MSITDSSISWRRWWPVRPIRFIWNFPLNWFSTLIPYNHITAGDFFIGNDFLIARRCLLPFRNFRRDRDIGRLPPEMNVYAILFNSSKNLGTSIMLQHFTRNRYLFRPIVEENNIYETPSIKDRPDSLATASGQCLPKQKDRRFSFSIDTRMLFIPVVACHQIYPVCIVSQANPRLLYRCKGYSPLSNWLSPDEHLPSGPNPPRWNRKTYWPVFIQRKAIRNPG